MAGLVALDASVLIALVNGADEHHETARRLFTDTLEAELCISALTFAEVLVHPVRNDLGSAFLESISGLGLEVHALTSEQTLRLAEIRARSGLRMPDASVLHLAVETGATLATFDTQLAASAQAFGVSVYQTRID